MRLRSLPLSRIILVAGLLESAARALPPSRPEFDVVSIKPSRFSGSGAVAIGAQRTPGTVTLIAFKPRDLIAQAYALKPYQIAGPNWLDEAYYELVVGKGGLKVRPTADAKVTPRTYPNGRTAIRAQAISMARLSDLLSAKLDRPVLDRTGTSGAFDIDLKWAADSDAEPGPSLFTAIQEQLGLQLRGAKSPIEVLVIEHINRPSEN